MTRPITWTPDAEEALARIKGRLFCTTTEASVILGYDRIGRTIRAAIEAGEIPFVRLGRTYRIPVKWLEAKAQLGTSGGDDAA